MDNFTQNRHITYYVVLLLITNSFYQLLTFLLNMGILLIAEALW